MGGISRRTLLGGLAALTVSDDAAHLYGEGPHQGTTLLGVVTGDATAPEVEAILAQHEALRIQERRGAWRRIWPGRSAGRGWCPEASPVIDPARGVAAGAISPAKPLQTRLDTSATLTDDRS